MCGQLANCFVSLAVLLDITYHSFDISYQTTTPMITLVRSAVLSNFIDVASGLGLDPHRLVIAAGLHPDCLTERDLRVPVASIRQLLEQAAVQSGVDNFGLRMAETRRLSVFGELGIAARDAPTLRHLLGYLLNHMAVHNEALRVHMEDLGGMTLIRWDSLEQQRSNVSQAVELTLGTVARIIRLYQHDDRQSIRAYFVHQCPNDTKLHQRIFGPWIEFDAEFDGIVCDNAVLDAPMTTADPVMAGYAGRLFDARHPMEKPSATREVRQLILILLPKGRCSLENVARHVGVGRQTLHRQLAREGTQFSALVQRVRMDLSDRFLAQSSRSLSQVALLLGFSELSGYTRWHQQALGEAPSLRRRRMLAAAATGSRPQG